MKAVIKYLGNIEIFINNTGGPPPSTFEQLSDEDWQKHLIQP